MMLRLGFMHYESKIQYSFRKLLKNFYRKATSFFSLIQQLLNYLNCTAGKGFLLSEGL